MKPKLRREHRAANAEIARFNRDRHRRKLNSTLSQADDEQFQILIWAADRLRAGDVERAQNLLMFPPQAAAARIGDPYYIAPWELETLLNERLALPPLQLRPDARNRVLNCRSFGALSQVVNLLRRLEDAEIGVALRRMNVMREIPRIGHRQFEWQRGFWHTETVYRWTFLFGGQLCQSYFEKKTGISIPLFIFYGVCVHGLFELNPGWTYRQLCELPTFNPELAAAGLRLLSAPIAEAREGARRLKRMARLTSYQPSQYRQTPLILHGDPPRVSAPLRDLIQIRITSGLFYDVADAPQAVRNEISDRFEGYVRDLLEGSLPGLQATRSVTYRFNGNTLYSPDVLLKSAERIAAIFECKARKMSFAARYAEDPIAEGNAGFDELVKGICQLWRFFAHAQLGLLPDTVVDPTTAGILLTLDNWTTMSGELQTELLGLARERSAAQHPEVLDEDRRRIVFCSVEELEQTLAGANEDQFLADLRLSVEDRYAGWILLNVHRDAFGEPKAMRLYPFNDRLGDVLPWWDELDALAAALTAQAAH